ncbi:MAG: SLC13/DASS family transporter [Pseudobacteriovorax sp.]|nr:SLC13/DASS family transporter [Pseudobacteriovorax sp.]
MGKNFFTFLLLIVWLGGVAFSESFGLTLSPAQSRVAMLLGVATILWVSEIVPLFVVSFIILGTNLIFIAPVAVTKHASTVYFEPFFSSIILLFLGGFVVSKLFQTYHFDKQLAMMLLKYTKGRSLQLLIGMVLLAAGLSMWMSNTATAAVVLVLLLPIATQLDQDDPLRKSLFLAVPFACNIGGFATPIGSPPNAIALAALQKNGYQVGFLQWFSWTFPIVMILCLLIIGVLWVCYRPKHSVVVFDESSLEKPQWTKPRIMALMIIILTILGWMFSRQLGVASSTMSLLPIIGAFSLKLLDEGSFKQLPWDVIFMVGGGVSLGLSLQAAGIDQTIRDLLNGWKEVSLAAMVILGILVMALSTFMSNTATAGLILPLVVVVGDRFDLAEEGALLVTLACSAAMTLPISTPPNSIAFSSGMLEVRDIVKAGSVISLVSVTIISICALGYWRWVL